MALFDNLKGTTSYDFYIGRFLNKVFFRSNNGIAEVKNVGGSYFPIESSGNKNTPGGYLGLNVNNQFNLSTYSNTRIARYTVVNPFAPGEVIDLTNGTGAVLGGTATIDGTPTTITLPASAALFKQTAFCSIFLNGVLCVPGDDVFWVSTTSLNFALGLDAGEVFWVVSSV
ncbi:MAG TPA: hypothetical protein PK079_22660 [Leptospiraceae bacterium]|nr:hypothetical protein [Leptospiraceae bacterium]HNC59902.1 hypothetical protein [Leptospiraceae bacterium]HNE55985.1 hypothetical protein [Leptospiraceae bacterium]HNF57501.1 hypothetical protein [Leptospiraceae bacterium]